MTVHYRRSHEQSRTPPAAPRVVGFADVRVPGDTGDRGRRRVVLGTRALRTSVSNQWLGSEIQHGRTTLAAEILPDRRAVQRVGLRLERVLVPADKCHVLFTGNVLVL